MTPGTIFLTVWLIGCFVILARNQWTWVNEKRVFDDVGVILNRTQKLIDSPNQSHNTHYRIEVMLNDTRKILDSMPTHGKIMWDLLNWDFGKYVDLGYRRVYRL
jgi:hypothetical protein